MMKIIPDFLIFVVNNINGMPVIKGATNNEIG